MTIDTYKLTSLEEPSDEVLEQLMREAAEEATQTNREATTRFFEEIKQAAAAYWYEHHLSTLFILSYFYLYIQKLYLSLQQIKKNCNYDSNTDECRTAP